MFAARAISGIAMIAVSITAIGLGGYRLISAADQQTSRSAPEAPTQTEVQLVQPQNTEFSPVLKAQGRIQAARQFRINSPVSGTLVQLNSNLNAGATIQEGELLAALDPVPLTDAIRRAELDIEAAKNEQTESQLRLELAEQELAAATAQRELRERQLARIDSLIQRQLSSQAEREAAEVTLAGARLSKRSFAPSQTDTSGLDPKSTPASTLSEKAPT